MIGPFAIASAALAILSDEDEGDVEDDLKRAFLTRDWLEYLRVAVGLDRDLKQLSASRLLELWEKALAVIRHLKDWSMEVTSLDESKSKLEVLFGVHEAAHALFEEIRESGVTEIEYPTYRDLWTPPKEFATPEFSPKLSSSKILIVEKGVPAQDVARARDEGVMVFFEEPLPRGAVRPGMEIFARDDDPSVGCALLSWDDDRVLLGEEDEFGMMAISKLKTAPLPSAFRANRELIDAYVFRASHGRYTTSEKIAQGMADAFMDDAWWSFREDLSQMAGAKAAKKLPQNLDAPSLEAWVYAMELWQEFQGNDVNLSRLFAQNWPRENPIDFGRKLALQAMGHGVSWGDDYDDFDLDVPEVENNLRWEYDIFSAIASV